MSKFFVVFMIFFVAFGISLNNLYWYYSNSTRSLLETVVHNKTHAEVNFGNMVSSMITIFWSMFGLGNPEDVELAPFDNLVTVWFGRFIYGIYHVCCIIILLNMLIASMTQSYEKILVSSHVPLMDTIYRMVRMRTIYRIVKMGTIYRIVRMGTIYSMVKILFTIK